MKKLTTLLLLLFLPTISNAELLAKKDNPNDVYAFFGVEFGHGEKAECPVTVEEANDIGNGVLVRSRLKRLTSWNANEAVLAINMECLDTKDGRWIYYIHADIVRLNITDNGIQSTKNLLAGRGRVGLAKKDFILAAYKDAVEDVVTDYLKANFDLGNDAE